MVTIHIVRTLSSFRELRAITYWHRSQAFVFSAVLHTGVMLLMASFAVQTNTAGNVITLFRTNESPELDQPFLTDDAEVAVLLPLAASASLSSHSIEFTDSQLPIIDLTSAGNTDLTPPPLSALLPTKGPDTPTQVSSFEEVGDMLADNVKERLREKDLLVVWLLDASHSVADDREQLASGFTSFYQHFTRQTGHSHRLLNAVVAFGANMQELVAPTESHLHIMDAVRKLTADDSGTENTFEAIEKCVVAYRGDWPDLGLLIVTWTDESGDDAGRLEHTIQVCRANDVSVSVVGPLAILGAEIATEPFADPIFHEIHQLPLTRGPDSAMPERIELGYWFLTQEPHGSQEPDRGFKLAGLPSWFGAGNRVFGDYKCIAATKVELPTWYGGEQLTGLVSGYGPYALTRLSSQTGGTYVILADDNHTGPFHLETLRPYLPDYRSVDVYSRDIESKPLRRAVMGAVTTCSR